jgi:Protein of unknown function (DUF1569)
LPTLLNQTDREAILERLQRMTPDRTPTWGTLTAPRLLCHLADQLRVALGLIPVARHDTLLSRTVLKWLVVDTPFQAPPGKVTTAPEMLTSVPTIWSGDMESVQTLIRCITTTPTTAIHPVFGPLTHDEWCRLAWKHLDHHLRQFGL